MISFPPFHSDVSFFDQVDHPRPADGVSFCLTLTQDVLRSIVSMHWSFIAGPGVANRYCEIVFQRDSGGYLFSYRSPVPILAGEICQWSAFVGAPLSQHVADSGTGLWPLPPDTFLTNGDGIYITIYGILAADTLVGITIQSKIWRTD